MFNVNVIDANKVTACQCTGCARKSKPCPEFIYHGKLFNMSSRHDEIQ